jgi:isoquinoline 1-oxidoreductase alpha subunit
MITLTVNGKTREVDAAPDTPLLWALRDHLGVTSPKYGCGMALCGACTVFLDGEAVRSCAVPLAAAAGKAVTTLEGLDSPAGRAVKDAWERHQVVQCGFCTPGQVMTATALLQRNAQPTEAEIEAAMGQSLCRCATYARVRSALREAAKTLATGGAT